jgi:hypothetical protein
MRVLPQETPRMTDETAPETAPETEQIEVPPMEASDDWLKVFHYNAKANSISPAYLLIPEITAVVQVGQLAEIVVAGGPCSVLVPYPAAEVVAKLVENV